MARRELAVAENAPGDLFVDDSCIECDTCRELAPDVFGSLDSGQSFVRAQPSDDGTWRRALHAVVSCPTSSIGTERSAKEAAREPRKQQQASLFGPDALPEIRKQLAEILELLK